MRVIQSAVCISDSKLEFCTYFVEIYAVFLLNQLSCLYQHLLCCIATIRVYKYLCSYLTLLVFSSLTLSAHLVTVTFLSLLGENRTNIILVILQFVYVQHNKQGSTFLPLPCYRTMLWQVIRPPVRDVEILWSYILG